MSTAVKITSKGQVTIPKEIRDLLNTDVVEFELIEGNVVIKPVKSVGGSLSKYARKYVPLERIRDKVWEDVAGDRVSKKTT